ncbi:MAG: glutamate 5-kinase [Myxococcota bacterium]|nr:glutamate 5-kinase [Myxococcota bacterium]
MDSERQNLSSSHRVVVKLGTNVVMQSDRSPALDRLRALVQEMASLRNRGVEVLLVTSGAVGIGAGVLALKEVPKKLVDRQACAAAGQGALVALYCQLLEEQGLKGAQVLLTEHDFSDRYRYLNLHRTLERLLSLGVIPIINENDTISTDELALGKGEVFGDNDRLSALVASRIEASLLVLLTDVDGVYTGPPGEQGSVPVHRYDDSVEILLGKGSGSGRGGMGSKIDAAQVATTAGVAVVIANGTTPQILGSIVEGAEVGTLFPAHRVLTSRKRWLAFATASRGRIVVNEGARRALVEKHASLLPKGVIGVEGDFAAGDAVDLVDTEGHAFARGVSNFSSSQTRAARGLHTDALPDRGRDRTVVHCENLVILGEVPR